MLLTLLTTMLIDPFGVFENQSQFWPILIILMFINFYVLGFAAQVLESAIQGKKVSFNESLKVFFALWFFPIGIWYIQPLIKRVLDERTVEISQ